MVDKSLYLSVSDLNYYIMQKFKNDPYLHKVFLKGELSNFRYRRQSHQYFSLKDEKAKINVVMFRNSFEKLQFEPKEGMKVYVTGYVSVYAPQGSYQFYAQTMEPAGIGLLYEQLQQLKAKLAKEGLFDQERKKTLPRFPDHIAVVTSASGAVIHDIMVTVNRRFPHAAIDLYPAQVQGDTAKESLVAAMNQIEAQGSKYDVMIIGRGGGSLEDLWPFNEERVVRQVAAMSMPVISSVGHETDTTLCDLAADARAATPTAAAELATPNLSDELIHLHQLQTQLLTRMQTILHEKKRQFVQIMNSIIMREPIRLYDQQAQTLDLLTQRLQNAMKNQLSQKHQAYRLVDQKLMTATPQKQLYQVQQNCRFLTQRLQSVIQRLMQEKKHTAGQLIQQLDDISPLRTLARGFTYTSDEKGKMVTSTKQLTTQMPLNLHFKDGQAWTRVEKIRSNQNDKNK